MPQPNTNTGPEHGALILAAGASSRMGRPKAQLLLPDGRTLLESQVALLATAGCDPVVAVVGSCWEQIVLRIPPRARWVVNPFWAQGRFSSVATGLSVMPERRGYILLPVDTAGVRPATLRALLEEAERGRWIAVRPTYRGCPGRLMWISCPLARMLVRLGRRRREYRLDVFFDRISRRWETDDPAILNNINTLPDWQSFIASSRVSP